MFGAAKLIVACIPGAPFIVRNLVTKFFFFFPSRYAAFVALSDFLLDFQVMQKPSTSRTYREHVENTFILDVENMSRTCREHVY